MKKICFYFQVHQPFRLRTYRFFDIGKNHDYYDEFANKSIMRKVAEKCYLPMNQLLLELINKYDGKFKIAFSISGVVLDQMEMYAPDVLESFKKLAQTGKVEFLAETYAHSLSALTDREEFETQVANHVKKVKEHFNQTPTVFRNTELIYSDHIGSIVADMGYKGMLTEGAKHIMAWKSPNYVYTNTINPRLKLLLKNFKLSDDIAFRFSNREWNQWPLTTEKYIEWIRNLDGKEEIVNLFMDYETFGEHQWEETGIFEFMRALPDAAFRHGAFEFVTPSEAIDQLQPVGPLHIQEPISWADEERDLTAWLGNELQDDAFEKLYSLWKIVRSKDDPDLLRDWRYLQTSDHFYYMCTKWFSDGDVHKYFNPYGSPYEAYINFMNVLSDFKIRLGEGTNEKAEVERLKKLTKQQEEKIRELNVKIGEVSRKETKTTVKKK
ncbi:MAG: glycoside hydrolase family 57 protein [Salinivirgaceae bacterium]